jgi:hypothetical protein
MSQLEISLKDVSTGPKSWLLVEQGIDVGWSVDETGHTVFDGFHKGLRHKEGTVRELGICAVSSRPHLARNKGHRGGFHGD